MPRGQQLARLRRRRLGHPHVGGAEEAAPGARARHEDELGERVRAVGRREPRGEVGRRAGLRQVKVVESEKAVHLGYFLNGKNQDLLPGEERIVAGQPDDEPEVPPVPEKHSKPKRKKDR